MFSKRKIMLCCLGLAAVSSFHGARAEQKQGSAKLPAQSTLKTNLLERDPRLRQKVSLERLSVPISQLLRTLTQKTGIKFTIADKSIPLVRLSLSFQDAPLKDVMDAVAAWGDYGWVKTGEGVYALLPPDDPNSSYLPQTVWDQEIFAAGKQFAAAASALLPEAQERLSVNPDNYAIGERVPQELKFSELPSAMQELVRRVVRAESEKEKQSGEQFPVTINDLSNATVSFHVQPINGTDVSSSKEYHLGVGTERGTGGVTFTNFDELRSKRLAMLASSGYDPQKVSPTKEQIARDARLNQKVSLNVGRVSLTYALEKLSEKTGFSFVTEARNKLSQTRQVFFDELPLRELLSRLTEQYRKTEVGLEEKWVYRPGGAIIVHRVEMPVPNKPNKMTQVNSVNNG